ncbi:MAG: VanZ family protein [Nitrospiria bacterium]
MDRIRFDLFLNRKDQVWKIILISGMTMAFILFFIGGPKTNSSRSYQEAWNLGHVLFFFVGSNILLRKWKTLSQFSWKKQVLWIVGLTLFFGISIEWTQMKFNRTAGVDDVKKDLIGSLIALSFSPAGINVRPRGLLQTFKLVVLLWLSFEVLPFAKALTDEAYAWKQFPVLSNFETPLEMDRWWGNSRRTIDHEIVFEGTSSMKVHLNTAKYSGVQLGYFSGNWNQASFLHFSIYNPSQHPLKIECNLRDDVHAQNGSPYEDRFNTSLTLFQGWNHFNIPIEKIANAPKNRRMNLQKMKRLSLFAVKLPEGKTIYIDDVRLVLSRNQQ